MTEHPLRFSAGETIHPASPALLAGKQGYLVSFTNEQLADIQPVRFLSAEERATARAAAKERQVQEVAAVQRKLAAAHPALQPVIDHHKPDTPDGSGAACLGCDAGAYAEDSPEWPCSTIELILDGLGPHIGGN